MYTRVCWVYICDVQVPNTYIYIQYAPRNIHVGMYYLYILLYICICYYKLVALSWLTYLCKYIYICMYNMCREESSAPQPRISISASCVDGIRSPNYCGALLQLENVCNNNNNNNNIRNDDKEKNNENICFTIIMRYLCVVSYIAGRLFTSHRECSTS